MKSTILLAGRKTSHLKTLFIFAHVIKKNRAMCMLSIQDYNSGTSETLLCYLLDVGEASSVNASGICILSTYTNSVITK